MLSLYMWYNMNTILHELDHWVFLCCVSQWDIQTAIFLTGTPVQNNLRELYALLSFVSPQSFKISRIEKFVQKYSNTEKKEGKIWLY